MADVHDPDLASLDTPIDEIRVSTSWQNARALFASEPADLRILPDRSDRLPDGAPDLLAP
jgi:hypothetical protein